MKGLIDSTLREGEQTVGVSFDHRQKVEIISGLAKIGVEEIELGVVGSRNRDYSRLIRDARKVPGVGRTALWCRCLAKDIEKAAFLKPDVLSLSIPASELHLEKKMGRDRAWALLTLQKSVLFARQVGFTEISVGFEDATRADLSFLLDMVGAAARAGARRVRLADTVGTASPATMGKLVQAVHGRYDIEIGVHTHNDFGMATANTIAALEKGAQWADVTVLGLGERAGNARLEEVAGYLALISMQRRYRVEFIKKICNDVARWAGLEIAQAKPIVGEGVFACESGLHLQGLLKEPATYEPFAPHKVGAKRCLRFGEKIGQRALAESLVTKGVRARHLEEMVVAVQNQSRLKKRPLSHEELVIFAESVMVG